MYIWILLATIMVALAFFNVSPRVDKEHALNEIRAATVTNRFKAEHEAMLKTMECEIMYGQNNGWDYDNPSIPDSERASAYGPVDVSCFNPLAVKKRGGCTGNMITVNNESMKGFTVQDTSKIWSEYPNKNNFMTHIPLGYETDVAVFPSGIYHFVYCLTEYAENANSADQFIRCDLKQTTTSSGTETPENPMGATEPETPESPDNPTSNNVKKSNVGGYGRYLVTFAQIPEKWLSKTEDDNNFRYPLPIFANLLSKDSGAETIYGWTKCSSAGSCQMFGLNSRSGHIKRADEGRRSGEDKKGVSVDIVSFGNQRVEGEDGQVTTQKQRNVNQVFEYELLKEDALFWKNESFQANCTNTPCMFAYEVFPGTDTAYHCYNLMHEEQRMNSRKRRANSENNTETPTPENPVEPTE